MKNFLILFFALFGFASYGQSAAGSGGYGELPPKSGLGLGGSGVLSGLSCGSVPGRGATCGFGVTAFKSPELGDLHYSASVGDEREVRRIINKYGSLPVNKRNPLGQVALHHVKNARIADILIQASPSTVHMTDLFGRTPIYYARTKKIASTFLAHGARHNIRDEFGKTPVEHNAIEGRFESATVLGMLDQQRASQQHGNNLNKR